MKPDSCAAYCVRLIRAVMAEEVPPALPENVSLEALWAFSRHHGVEAMVFHGLSQLGAPLTQAHQNRCDLLLTQSLVQLAERDSLFAAFSGAKIPVLPVKGCWLKEQYPQIHFRQMSDLDILIHPEDIPAVHEIMTGLGYKPEEEDTAEHHLCYHKAPYVTVELHTDLIRPENPHHLYYKNIWKRAKKEGGLYRLSPEDEYIFYLLHMLNHVLYAGIGIRTFLDHRVYYTVFPDMDTQYLQREYRKLGITAFARQVAALSDCWFGSGDPVPEELEPLQALVWRSGSYGLETAVDSNPISFAYPLRWRAGVVLEKVFPDLRAMATRFPLLKTYPYLLPLCWILRMFRIGLRALSPKKEETP